MKNELEELKLAIRTLTFQVEFLEKQVLGPGNISKYKKAFPMPGENPYFSMNMKDTYETENLFKIDKVSRIDEAEYKLGRKKKKTRRKKLPTITD